MTINWPLIIVLFCLSIPGCVIAIKRLIYFLLADSSDEVKKRMYRLAMLQSLFMVLIMSFAGAVLSANTGLHDAVLEGLLQGTLGISALLPLLLPSFLYAFVGLLIFLVLYYGLMARIVDEKSLQIMFHFRRALGADGCVLYGGVVEEVIARWGLMNLTAFFIMLFTRQYPNLVIWTAIIISGLMFAAGQIPAYLAAGCLSSRRFIYSLLALSLYQSIFFGYLFWKFGLIVAILAHMLFHMGWAIYEPRKSS